MPEIEAMCPNIKSHEELWRFSVEQPDKFWGELARSRLSWSQDFHTSMDCDMKSGKFDWFLGGRLNVSVNCVGKNELTAPNSFPIYLTKSFMFIQSILIIITLNCVDRWAKQDPDRVAIIWEKDEPGQEETLTYSELERLVCRVANCLRLECEYCS